VTIEKLHNWSSGQVIALVLIIMAGMLSTVVFWVSRNDHDMKLLALGGVLGFCAGATATASTLLVGKPADPAASRLPPVSDLAPGGTATSTDSITAPTV
jgi:hypothetical protein